MTTGWALLVGFGTTFVAPVHRGTSCRLVVVLTAVRRLSLFIRCVDWLWMRRATEVRVPSSIDALVTTNDCRWAWVRYAGDSGYTTHRRRARRFRVCPYGRTRIVRTNHAHVLYGYRKFECGDARTRERASRGHWEVCLSSLYPPSLLGCRLDLDERTSATTRT